MKRILIMSLMLSTIALAQGTESEVGFEASPEQISTHSIKQRAQGEIFTNPQQIQEKAKEKRGSDSSKIKKYMLIKYLMDKKPSVTPSESTLVKIKEKQKKQTVSGNPQIKQQRGSVKSGEKIIFTEGYCIAPNDIEVSTKKMFYTFPCQLKKVGSVSVFGELVPDFEGRFLAFKPLEVRNQEGEKIYVIQSGIALSGDKTSYNVASYVNIRAIEKIVANTSAKTAEEVAGAYKEYYENKNKQVVVGSGGATVETNQYPSNYPLVMGAVSFAKGLVEGIAELVKSEVNRMPALFKIRKGSSIYIQAYLKPFNPSKEAKK